MRGILKAFQGLAFLKVSQDYLYDFRVAVGESMLPTYRAGGDLLLINKVTSDYQKGDIVIVNSPVKPGFELCKRIVAIEGETVRNQNQTYAIPKGYYWVEGDNKEYSIDSRSFGPICKSSIIGKVAYKIWR